MARVVATDVLEPGAAAAHRQARRLRLVARAHASRRCATRSPPRSWPRATGRLGCGSSRSSAPISTTSGRTGDVELEGDPELQQAVRFALFHVLSCGRARRGRGHPGQGADRHRLRRPLLLGQRSLRRCRCSRTPRRKPRPMRCAGGTRRSTTAKARARDLGLAGAAFPWRTIHGEECSGYWPAGTAAFHVNADIAAAVHPVRRRDRRQAFERDDRPRAPRRDGAAVALARPLRPSTATSASTASPAPTSTARSPTTTSTRTSWRSGTCSAPPTPASATRTGRATLGVTPDEMASWRARRRARGASRTTRSSASTSSPRGSRAHEPWDFADDGGRTSIRCCCTFRTSISIASRSSSSPTSCWRCSCAASAFTPEQRARNFDYYERITVRDSSLSACTEAVAAADAGHLRLAFDYAAEAALMDLHDLEHNARDGLHLASLAGTWIAFVCGFGGMRGRGETLDVRAAAARRADAARVLDPAARALSARGDQDERGELRDHQGQGRHADHASRQAGRSHERRRAGDAADSAGAGASGAGAAGGARAEASVAGVGPPFCARDIVWG